MDYENSDCLICSETRTKKPNPVITSTSKSIENSNVNFVFNF